MSTGQKYSGEGDSTTPPDPNGSSLEQTVQNNRLTAILEAVKSQQGAVLIPKSYVEGKYLSPHTLEQNAFVDSCFDLAYVSRMRQAIRSWFCCFLPEDVHTTVHGPTIEQASVLFQDMDEFLNDLMVASYNELEAEQARQLEEFKRLEAKFAELDARTAAIDEKANVISVQIDQATFRSDN